MEQTFDKSAYNKAYYQAHKAERAAYAREWRSKNKDKVKESNHEQYLKRKARKKVADNEPTSKKSKNVG